MALSEKDAPFVVTVRLKSDEEICGIQSGDESVHPDFMILTCGAGEHWIAVTEIKEVFFVPKSKIN